MKILTLKQKNMKQIRSLLSLAHEESRERVRDILGFDLARIKIGKLGSSLFHMA
jgi:hypothetical protein